MKKRLLRPWFITLIIGCLYISWILSLGGGAPLVFAEIGTRFSEGDPAGTEGYDGQFFYYIAVDPATAPQKIDVPAYRFQRILYPLLVRFLAGAKPGLIPWMLVALNLAGLVGSVWIVEKLLTGQHVNYWHALPVGLYAGQLLSIRVDLPEPVALVFVLLAMYLFEQRETWQTKGETLSILFFIMAIFTKETALVSAAAYVFYLLSQKEVKKGLIWAACFLVPFGLYQGYLYLWLGSPGIGSGGAGATSFEVIPLAGLLRMAQTSWEAFGLYLLILGPIVILPTLWALYATGRDLLFRRWHPWTLALTLNAFIILFLPYSTFREPLAMLRFTVPLVALTILYSARIRSWRALNYSFLWLATLVFLIRDPLWQ